MRSMVMTHGRQIICTAVALSWFTLLATLSGLPSSQPSGRDLAAGFPSRSVAANVTPLTPQSQTTLSPLADARVKDSSASSNYGTDSNIRTRLSSSSSNYESYLKFDLSSVSSGISSAKLRLFGNPNDTSSLNVPTAVFAVSNTTWTETGINWSNKPAAATSALATVIVTDAVARFYEWDLTSYIQSEQSAGRNVVTLALKAAATSSPYTIFNSKE